MTGNAFKPPLLVAIADDSVVWTNRDFALFHDVTGSDFASPTLAPGESFEHRFSAVGRHAYVCTYHPLSMRGSVAVYHAYLAPPSGSVLHGRTLILHGLARQGREVTIERADGTPVGTATASIEGRFSFSYAARGPSVDLRAVTTDGASPTVRVAVRPRLAISARRSRGRHLVSVSATPAQVGAKVAVERSTGFGWKRLARGALGAASKATLRIDVAGTARIRARITQAVGGYAPALSATIRVRD